MKSKNILFHFSICALQLIMLAGIQTVDAQVSSDMKDPKPEKVFRAGAATSNITPFLGGGIVGNYGTPPPAIHVHDELHARCLVLDDGTTRLAFIIVDNIGMNRDLIDEAKRLIRAESRIPKAVSSCCPTIMRFAPLSAGNRIEVGSLMATGSPTQTCGG